MKRRATTDLGLPFWSCRLMTPEESAGDSRLERIEKRLSRLEDAISVLQEATKTGSGSTIYWGREGFSPDGEEAMDAVSSISLRVSGEGPSLPIRSRD
jgi:hypothetical protein